VSVESATYIKSLDPTSPSGTDPIADGDDHLRLLKAVLKATFPNLDGPVTATPGQLNSGVPIGLVAIWPFSIATIPQGWAICNGQTVTRSDGQGTITTPNLLDKFVMGTSLDASVGTTGGSSSVTVSTDIQGAHTHDGGTDTRGAHNHGGSVALAPGGSEPGTGGNYGHSIGQDGAHFHYFTTNSNGSHSHSVTVTTLPPYIKYPYIMKV
jgi:hypothetical protein